MSQQAKQTVSNVHVSHAQRTDEPGAVLELSLDELGMVGGGVAESAPLSRRR